jgi:hypothetical protein
LDLIAALRDAEQDASPFVAALFSKGDAGGVGHGRLGVLAVALAAAEEVCAPCHWHHMETYGI